MCNVYIYLSSWGVTRRLHSARALLSSVREDERAVLDTRLLLLHIYPSRWRVTRRLQSMRVSSRPLVRTMAPPGAGTRLKTSQSSTRGSLSLYRWGDSGRIISFFSRSIIWMTGKVILVLLRTEDMKFAKRSSKFIVKLKGMIHQHQALL